MKITSLTPNIDSFLFVELEDEHRIKSYHPIILFAVIHSSDLQPDNIGCIINRNGELTMPIGRFKIVRKDDDDIT